MKKAFLLTLVLLAGTGIALETGLRLYQNIRPGFAFMPDDTYLRYRGVPHSMELNGFRLNSRGYKDTEFNTARKPGVIRIIGIGDSQTYGAVPYDRCYMTLLEQYLNANAVPCEVYNMGVPAAAPIDYLSLLIHEGLDLRPDLVLVNIFLGDDCNRGGARVRFYNRSVAATFINSIAAGWWPPSGRIFASGSYRDNALIRDDDSYAAYLRDVQAPSFDLRREGLDDELSSSIGLILRMKEHCDLHGVSFAAVLCPSDLQMYRGLRRSVLASIHAREDDYDFRLPNRKFATAFAGRGIPLLDLLDLFITCHENGGTRLTHHNDAHWNLRGNLLAAVTVSAWLAPVITNMRRAGIKTRNHRQSAPRTP